MKQILLALAIMSLSGCIYQQDTAAYERAKKDSVEIAKGLHQKVDELAKRYALLSDPADVVAYAIVDECGMEIDRVARNRYMATGGGSEFAGRGYGVDGMADRMTEKQERIEKDVKRETWSKAVSIIIRIRNNNRIAKETKE